MEGRGVPGIRGKRVGLAAVLVLAGLALVVGVPSPASACSAFEQTARQYFDQADVVFEGVHVSGRDPSAGSTLVSGLEPVFFTFAADRLLKGGPISAQVEVSSSRSGASCGANFTVGVRYRVYASNVSGALTTSSVSGNRPVPLVAPTTIAPQRNQPSNASPAAPRSGTPRFTG